jgi:maltose O-acetyltransferase
MLRILKTFYHRLLVYKKQKYIARLQQKGLKLGKNVDLVDTFFFDSSHCYLISIGDNTTICPNVRLIAHDASTKKSLGYAKFGRIIIGKNCFIGDSTIILPNVTIGDNSIIGAGSVVTRSMPADSVAVGNPAKVISSVGIYLKKIEELQKCSKVFGKDYLVANLDDAKRAELLREAEKGIGFIV